MERGTVGAKGVGALTPVSGTASGSGDNLIVTPSAGKKVRVYFASYNPSAPVTAGFRFGSSGLWLLNNITVAGSIIMKDFGDLRYVEGQPDQVLNLNLSSGVSTIWNIFYVEA